MEVKRGSGMREKLGGQEKPDFEDYNHAECVLIVKIPGSQRTALNMRKIIIFLLKTKTN